MLQREGQHPTPGPGDSWPITCQGSGTTAVPTAPAQTLIQENKVPTLCPEFQSVPCAAGQSQRQASRAALAGSTLPGPRQTPETLMGPHTRQGAEPRTLWAARGVAAPAPPERRLKTSLPSRGQPLPFQRKQGKKPHDRRWTHAHRPALSWSSPAHEGGPVPTSQMGLGPGEP